MTWRRHSQGGVGPLNQGSERPPSMVSLPRRQLPRGCALRRRLPCAPDVSLGRTHLIYTEMGTLRLVWHIFECFYYLCEPKFWSVSGLKASLPLWIMNWNEAFCVDYLMIHSNIAVTSGCAEEKKKYRMCSGGIFDSWPFFYDLLFWDTQFEKQIVWY